MCILITYIIAFILIKLGFMLERKWGLVIKKEDVVKYGDADWTEYTAGWKRLAIIFSFIPFINVAFGIVHLIRILTLSVKDNGSDGKGFLDKLF